MAILKPDVTQIVVRLKKMCGYVLAICVLQSLFGARLMASESLSERLNDYLTRLAGFGYSGSILVVRDGEIILRNGYGYADAAKGVHNTPETVFDIGSLSKTLTATAVLQLEAAGKMSLNDSVAKYFPQAPQDKQSITIRQLFSHTSGIAAPAPAYRVISKEETLKQIFTTPLKFAPGTKWDYSNAGYVVLAAVIESTSGESYQHYMIRHIFRPSGMKSTGFWGSALPHAPHLVLATGYDEFGVVTDLRQLSSETWNDIGSGQIVSNVEDLYRFWVRLQQGRLLPQRELQSMLTPVLASSPSDDYYTESYGYGIWINTLHDGAVRYQHGGDFLGFGSQLISIPRKRGLTIISLCNVRRELYPVHRRADRVIAQLIAGAAVSEPPHFTSLPASTLQGLKGSYTLSSGGHIAIYSGIWGLEVGAEGQHATTLLNGSFSKQAELQARGDEAVGLVTALFSGNDSGLSAVGLGDPAARNEIHKELNSLAESHGHFRDTQIVGTYLGGMLGQFYETVLRVRFDNGDACYRIEWSGKSVVGTDGLKCPRYAAATILQPASDHELIGWNIITANEVSLVFSSDLSQVQITSGGRTESASKRRP